MSNIKDHSTVPISGAKKMSGGDALVLGLHRWGVDTMFGVPGVQLDHLFDGLYRNKGDVRLIHTRHEQGAAYMAFGYATSTGKPGVCAVVPGPGILNAGAALSTAYACNAPVLCLTSTINSALIDRKYGALHEVDNQEGILRSLTKWTGRAAHASEIPGLVDEAFRQLLTGRPRPVALEIPPDILAQQAMIAYPKDLPDLTSPAVDQDLIEKAVALCRDAQNPMIVVGSGAQGASDQILRLAEILQAPVVSRHMGRGVLPYGHDLAIPAAAAIPRWADADLVIGIGTRLQQLREWGHDSKLKVVRIDLDQAEMQRVVPADAAICADAAVGTAALVEKLESANISNADRTAEYAAVNADFRNAIVEEMQPQMGYLDAIRAEMTPDDVFVDEMTQVGYVSRFGMPILKPRTYVCSSYQGTLGYGYATAIGAQVGAGTRQVISINGDGGFMFTMPELATAVLHEIPLIAIVFADGNFGNVRNIQKGAYGGRLIASHLHNPDFVELAKNFGATGLRAHNPEELREAIREAKAAGKPALIEVPYDIDNSASPWKHVHGRKVR
ncbi:thiamine pyrophosphate-dependent enzyme [Parasphingorhabdus cellanae]|uniref:Uncharacterized protein n=1 Tax=Parasphingorhabdus cellanae TaxID=2806553 RepID=A0ABX7T2P5_9SPHN|nr:thiamine pyrophosphate-dependent enzyme [Parasphingorhabdus cellanae]QTD55825.1 hypothetical protein J4G78_16805 [Parasphingorhabdus cellanae]